MPPIVPADVNVDLGRGRAHAKEWLENNVFKPGHKTKQSPVYALLYAQNILPHCTLALTPQTTSRTLTRMRSIGAAKGRRLRRPRRAPPIGRRARKRRSR